jgi:two-component system OmpR family response regulator
VTRPRKGRLLGGCQRGSNPPLAFFVGHHRLIVLHEPYLPDHEANLIVRDLSDEDMSHVMADENMQEFGSNSLIEQETTRAVARCLHPHFPDHDRTKGATVAVNETRKAVLIVDDDADLRDVLRVLFAGFGLEVLTAAGGDEALDLYRRHRNAVGVVLLDVRMPGKDGPQTLAELRRLDPAVRSVFMTGFTAPYDRDELLRRGAVAVVTKPFPSVKQLAGLLGLLAQAPPGDATSPRPP